MATQATTERKRILFVDDDPNVVQGLRRLLRPYREQWDMSFTTSAIEALELVKGQGFDIVITDMRMPAMSGAELLTEIQRIAPRTVRMILSGHSEVSSIVKSVGPSHQFLAKPCDPAQLEACIKRAFALRQGTSDPRILDLIGGVATIPSIPALYQEVVAAIKEERSLAEIGALVAQDMGMTTRLLQLVNSSYFGMARKVDDAAKAVMMIGMETLQSLVLGAKIFEQFPAKDETALQEIWLHSSRAAALARKLCAIEKIDAVLTNQTMVASFLHDVGLVALAGRAPELFAKVWAERHSPPGELEPLERETLGASHAQIGASLLSLWGLPDPIAEAVAFHHCPGPSVSGAIGPLTFVHVVQAFACAVPECDDAEALRRSGIDLDYLERVGATSRLPTWRQACARAHAGN